MTAIHCPRCGGPISGGFVICPKCTDELNRAQAKRRKMTSLFFTIVIAVVVYILVKRGILSAILRSLGP